MINMSLSMLKIFLRTSSGKSFICNRWRRNLPPLHQNIVRQFSSSDVRPENKDEHKMKMKQVSVPDLDTGFKGLETDFPCLTKNKMSGPEPEYTNVKTGFKVFHHKQPFKMFYNGGVLPEMQVAYETWGELNEAKDNAVLLCTGVSANSHARSHQDNKAPGWWERFIGSGCALDTDKFFVICCNNLGSCFGSTGPSSINPLTEEPYATTFPIVSIQDMVASQFLLLDDLGIDKVYAAVGSSLGGMLSLASGVMFPDRVKRVVSISACAAPHPTSIAIRYLQRKAIMLDPHWNKGHYYGGTYPKLGMKLSREMATMTYRSGPEWEKRFGRQLIDEEVPPSLCPTFMIENYLDYQGEASCMKLDPNTQLYLTKAADLFDMRQLGEDGSLENALKKVKASVMVIGVQSDILFPVWQQRELANSLEAAGHDAVTYFELNSIYGHDTFLLDLNGVGCAMKGFLETEPKEKGRARARKDKKPH